MSNRPIFKRLQYMEDLVLIVYEFITVMFPAMVIIVTFYKQYKKQNNIKNCWYIVLLMVFSVYLFGVYHYTGAGTIYDAKLYGMELKANQLNLIPFSDTEIDFVAYGLNVVLFIPLGFLLPLIWSNFNKSKLICIAGTSLSVVIEFSQLLNNRRTDVDDLILNTIGAMFGLMMFRMLLCITKHPSYQTGKYKHEMIIITLVTFFCRFFVYNEFGAAKVLFGF